MIDKFENMESNIIRKEFLQWIVEWPSPLTQSIISNNWPNLLESPCYEIGCCLWQCQLRKIQITKKQQNNNYYKLGVFIIPKQIKQFKHIIALNAKIKVIISIKYKEIITDQYCQYSPNQIIYNKDDDGNIIEKIQIEEDDSNDNNIDRPQLLDQTLQIKTKDITFDINTNFIKTVDEETRVMSWGKFIPELQDVIDSKSGLIPHDNICIDIKFQVIDQCLTYKGKAD